MADGPHFYQQGWHVSGPVNNAETIINNGADPQSIADGLALDRQRYQEALASQQAQQRAEQWLLEKRRTEQRKEDRSRTASFLAIGCGGAIALFIVFAILQDLLRNLVF
ncbi:hypothetical protein HTV80_32330 [Streptomyces sp. Vc74B-19]|uniref:hypothetical protein n=1 Tax=unclassified Streptomyces TaxID=2593676 RepID=UPI001BFC1333|nr:MULTISPECIES: hypothetical protein [unclassified Streptomyces]MBT3167741.1 hypothetical protein [Streptomyces sp. Vc74B-19]MDU0303074.1 hypothetical protein [Streptomyces sp. PAL114]